MKKFALGFAVFFMFTVNCFAENISTVPIRFMDIEWGSSQQEVEKTLINGGYTLEHKDMSLGFLTMYFKGKLGARNTVVLMMFHEDKLTKLMLVISTTETDYRNAYDEVLKALTTKYGKPNSSFEFFRYPYDKSDLRTPNEITAIKMNKGHIASFFENSDGTMLSVKIHRNLDIHASYESPEFAGFVEKEKAKENQIF